VNEKDHSILLIGLAVAALLAFMPPKEDGDNPKPTPGGDTLDVADDDYRLKLAEILTDFKDKTKTDATKTEFLEEFASARLVTHKEPNLEIFALWWNGKGEEAAERLTKRTLGQADEVPVEGGVQ
tara:strand:- start:9518 stop:9892 length:375 start_codon:yes stop_codon:yes gene_type:complete